MFLDRINPYHSVLRNCSKMSEMSVRGAFSLETEVEIRNWDAKKESSRMREIPRSSVRFHLCGMNALESRKKET